MDAGIKPNPNFDEIKQKLEKISKLRTSLSTVCYRCTDPKFADELISGRGSQIYGARWTPKNSFPTVYLCDSAEGALQEFFARARRMRLPDHRSLPMVMAWVKIRISNILDITDPEVATIVEPILAVEKIHWRSIQDRREAVSQAIGRAIMEICFAGLVTKSSAFPGGKNIVNFPRKLRAKDSMSAPTLQIID